MNKKKLSLIFAVGLHISSLAHASLDDIIHQRTMRMLNAIADNLATLWVRERAKKFIKTRDAQRLLFEKIALKQQPKGLEPITSSAFSLVETSRPDYSLAAQEAVGLTAGHSFKASAKPFNNGKYAALGVAVAGLMSGAEYLYDKAQAEVESAAPVVTPTVQSVEPVVEQNIHSAETSVGFLAKAKNIFTSYANKDAVQKGMNAVVTGVKTHKEAAIGAAGLVAFAGAMKAYEYYNTPTSTEGQSPVVEQAPIVEQAPVVEPVVEQAPVKEVSPVVKLTVAEIANTQGANVQGVIDALKAHGYTKIDLKASDLKQAGKLNDGQIRFIISRIR